jgi:hypothetical protein
MPGAKTMHRLTTMKPLAGNTTAGSPNRTRRDKKGRPANQSSKESNEEERTRMPSSVKWQPCSDIAAANRKRPPSKPRVQFRRIHSSHSGRKQN